ncbi:MAG: CYTH domain-containing protein [Candidatus Berkelbacteria bacterium]|nr:CYTH domain-containing protein [Candidatus Berkelbacteria bacterium]
MTKESNQEVELRAILTEKQRENLFDSVKAKGGIFESEEEITDHYFCVKTAKSFKEVEMDEVGSFSLRLRKCTKEGKTKTELNMKIITKSGDHHSWKEHEVLVDSFDQADAIVKVLGFKSYFTLEKKRTNFKIDEMLVIAEDIKDFGAALEVEIITSLDKSEEAKAKIKKLLDDLGVAPGQIAPKSITNILMHEKSVF